MQTIGERLEDARKRKGISIREAAEATKIRGDYLQKFESNQFNIGLTDIYVRGFLRSYAAFLQLPSDRVLNDYAAMGHTETRPRQPSREVYGRMDLSVASGTDHSERRGSNATSVEPDTMRTPIGAAAAPAADGPRPGLRPHASGLPAKRLDPALVYKIGFGAVGLIVLLLVVFLIKSLFTGSPKAAEHPSATAGPPITAGSPVPDAESTLALVATDPVALRVTRQADNMELYTGTLGRGEHKDFPNVGLNVTASPIEALHIRFNGGEYRFGGKGQMTTSLPVMH